MSQLKPGGNGRECCEKPENRELVEKVGTRTTERCKVCDAKHHTIEVDATQLGVVGAKVG